MTRKEYFNSDLCSKRAKTLIKANWIVFGVCAGISLVLSIIKFVGAFIIFKAIDFSRGIDYVIGELDKNNELDLKGITDAFNGMEDSLGMSATEFIQIVLYITIAVMAVFLLIALLLSFLTARKRTVGIAIASLVVSFFSGDWLLIGSAIALLVFACILNKEYKNYLMGNNNN